MIILDILAVAIILAIIVGYACFIAEKYKIRSTGTAPKRPEDIKAPEPPPWRVR